MLIVRGTISYVLLSAGILDTTSIPRYSNIEKSPINKGHATDKKPKSGESFFGGISSGVQTKCPKR
jgi:hypothetical protein